MRVVAILASAAITLAACAIAPDMSAPVSVSPGTALVLERYLAAPDGGVFLVSADGQSSVTFQCISTRDNRQCGVVNVAAHQACYAQTGGNCTIVAAGGRLARPYVIGDGPETPRHTYVDIWR